MRETGMAHLAARDYAAAIEALSAAEALAPKDDPLLLALGVALQGARRHEEALDCLARVSERGPNKAPALLHSAFSLLALGRALPARAAALYALTLAPGAAAAHFALGQAEVLLGRPEAAERAFMTAVEIEPSSADYLLRLATVRRHLGDLSGAEAALACALQLGPRRETANEATARSSRGDLLTVWNPTETRAALGLAADYLSKKATFARLPFGEWTRTLAHQAASGRQLFVIDGRQCVLGYLGWAVTTQSLAEQWLQGLQALSDEDCRSGDFVIINAFAAETKASARLLVDSARDLFKDKAAIYFKRFYRNGRVRAMRLSVNAFVTAHLARSAFKI
jgi:tetratricopeptide (TPR) repeat protein